MDQANIQQQVEQFLKSLDVPGFIIFGYKTKENQFSIVSSYNEMPTNAAIKGLSRVLAEFTERALP